MFNLLLKLALLATFSSATHTDDDPVYYCFFKSEVFDDKKCTGTPISCHLRFYTVDDCIKIGDKKSKKVTGCTKTSINFTEYETRNCDGTQKNTEKQIAGPTCENNVKNSYSKKMEKLNEFPKNPFTASCEALTAT